MDSQLKAIEQQFLKAIALELNLTGDSLAAFLARFSRENATEGNATLERRIAWNNQPEDGAQKLQDELARICKSLEEHGCPITRPDGQKKRGRASKGQSPWEQAYKWLWEVRFPEWRHNEQQVFRQEESCSNGQADINELVQQVRLCACARVLSLYSKIRLLNRQEIEVDSLYVDVYMLESRTFHATIPGLLEGKDQRDGFNRIAMGERGSRSLGLEVAAQQARLMVFGQPGSGKTTFLRYLAVACARGEVLSEYIPVLLELRDIFELRDIRDASKFDLWKLLEQELRLSDPSQLQQILDNGRILLLLDGLDEVSKTLQKDVQDHIWEFVKRSENNRFILTCRVQTTKYVLPTFDPVEVAEFQPKQVEVFAQKWFGRTAATPAEGVASKERFMAKLRENQPTADLAVTPMLLSLTCWVFDDLKDLPQKRSDLYQQGIDLLLQQWDEIDKNIAQRESGSELYHQSSPRKRQKLLSYVSFRKFEKEQYILFEHSELVQSIAEYLNISPEEGEIVLEDIAKQHGLLVERAPGLWSFSHLTFQEYFVAKWFCDRCDWKNLAHHITEKHWREVFLLAVEIPSDATALLQMMKSRVDEFLETDEELQQFLKWVDEKARFPLYKPAIRALHFAFAFDHDLIDICICDRMRGFSRAFAGVPHTYSKEFADSVACTDKFAFALDYALGSDSASRMSALARAVDSNFQQYLQKLKDQKPHWSNQKEFEQWWQEGGQFWIEQVNALEITPHGVGGNWQFTDTQKSQLQQYYDANKLLVDCLNRGCAVSNELKQEIRETLLLPFAEIK